MSVKASIFSDPRCERVEKVATKKSGMTAPAILCRPIANVPAAIFPVLSISQ